MSRGGAQPMSTLLITRLIWMAGAIHVGIVLGNIPLPRKLRVQQNLAGVPRFLRQVFYVHWFYIVLIVGLFAALCFGFANDLAGGTPLGRFLSFFIAGFWLLRLGLQWFYYDPELRRQIRVMDTLYTVVLSVMVIVFLFAGLRPVA
jgi:hypothetical protein